MDRIEIQMEIEEKYKLKIPEEAAAKLKTARDIIDYISSHYKKQQE